MFLMPLRGVSAIDSAGLPFSWPEADRSYLDALKANLDPRIRVAEVDAHINDEAFARNAAHCLLELLEQSQGRDAQTVRLGEILTNVFQAPDQGAPRRG